MNFRFGGVLPGAALLACLSSVGPTHAQARYTYSADDAEVTDTQTGLIWRRCSQGQTWIGSTCNGSASTFTHEQALAAAATQAKWRLPNVKELSSLVDSSRVNPSIDSTVFPNTLSNFWSSSPYAGDPSIAWVVGFDYGYVSSYYRSELLHVRLVR